jgi:hypothetical protein
VYLILLYDHEHEAYRPYVVRDDIDGFEEAVRLAQEEVTNLQERGVQEYTIEVHDAGGRTLWRDRTSIWRPEGV